MSRRLPIFYSALLLTAVNLLLRLAGTSFQVYLSGRIGAGGIGLLQLTLSVGNLAMVAGVAGIRTATMYLTAEELGADRPRNVGHILSGACLYSILCSCTVGLCLYLAAPLLAERWIGDWRTLPALRILAAFLPVACLCGVMTGYFTAAQRIGALAAVEVAEQFCSIAMTMGLLKFWAGQDPGRACLAVVLGSQVGCCLTLCCLVLLRLAERPESADPIPVRTRLLQAAVPLAGADIVRSGISTTENLLVPKRLKLYPGETDPMGAFGTVCGMVFPIIMFPACILFALAELLIPEMARCAAGGRKARIHYLVHRSLKTALLYGLVFSGWILLMAGELCRALYHSTQAGHWLRMYALLIPVLYCDAITDAMTKGLGQQRICVRYNILTSAMDTAFLFLLLPRYGMDGYYFSFLVTHVLNFALSLRRLCLITGIRIPFFVPALGASALLISVRLLWQLAAPARVLLYLPVLASLLTLFRIIGREDMHWLRGLILRTRRAEQT